MYLYLFLFVCPAVFLRFLLAATMRWDEIQDSQSISAPSNRAEVSRYKYKNKYVSWHCAHSDFEHGGGGRQCVDKIQDSQPYRCLKYWGPKICDATYHVLKGNLCL